MDQLKTPLAVIGKYGFWIASALVLLGSMGIWHMSTSALREENVSQTSKINSAIQTVKSVEQELFELPNDLSHEAMRELISKRRDEVVKSWEKLYNRQKGILVWPSNTFNKEFLDEFMDVDGNVKLPFEHYVEFPTQESDELETTLRRQYANYISKQLPKLAAVVDTDWTAAFDQSNSMGLMGNMGGQGRSGFGGGDTGPEVDITGATEESLVKWSEASQSALLGDLFPWRGALPSTLEIYYSQENLWILRQLLDIIHEVNGDAEQPYQAKIHEITKIAIGKSVGTTPGNISEPGNDASGDMGMGMDMDMDMEGMGDMDMGGDMGDGMGAMAESTDPAENRYLNAMAEPITGLALRSAMESNNPNDASLAVAKRVPVMMKLNMNQGAIHELVAGCGSADLMVEVHQVRVLPQSESSAGGGMGDMGGMEGEGMDDEADMGLGGGMGGGLGGMGGGLGGGTADDSEFPLDMSVEVYGIIYIYNPPDPVKLGVGQVTEDTVIDVVPGTMGEQEVKSTPAATPPPAGGTTPPPAGGTTPPPAGGTTPPPAGGTTPPPAGGTTPPPAGGTTPPPAGGTTPPPAGGTTPPPAGGTTPPPAGGTTPPPAGGTTPPVATGGSSTGPATPLASS